MSLAKTACRSRCLGTRNATTKARHGTERHAVKLVSASHKIRQDERRDTAENEKANKPTKGFRTLQTPFGKCLEAGHSRKTDDLCLSRTVHINTHYCNGEKVNEPTRGFKHFELHSGNVSKLNIVEKPTTFVHVRDSMTS